MQRRFKFYLLGISAVITLGSCFKDPINTEPLVFDLSGTYKDTFNFYHQPLNINIPDTIINKNIYKLTDSTFLMSSYYCTDTLSCTPFPAGKYLLKLRTDNSIIVSFPDDANYEFNNVLKDTAYFIPPSYIYVSINNITLGVRERHRIRK